MKKIRLISLRENLIKKIAEQIITSKKTENNLIIFPNKRPAYFLASYLSEIKKSPILSPKILSMDSFIELLFNQIYSHEYKTPSEPDCLSILIEGNFLLKSSEKGELNLNDILWGLKIISTFEECKIHLIKSEELKKFDFLIGEENSYFKKELRNDESAKTFSKLYDLFYEKCEEKKFFTRAMKYAYLSQNISKAEAFLNSFENIIFAGFFALTKSEMEIFEYIHKLNNSIFFYSNNPRVRDKIPFKEELSKLNDNLESETQIEFIKCISPHHEIFELKRKLEKEGKIRNGINEFDKDSAVIFPNSENIIAVLEHAFRGVKSFNISAGYPIKMTPIYSLISSLLALLRTKDEEYRYNAKEYFDFLFHPYIKNLRLSNKAEETRKLIQKLYQEFLKTKKTKLDLTNDQELISNEDLKEIHEKTLIPFKEINSLKDISDKLSSFIEYIKENSTAYLHPYWDFFPDVIMEKLYELSSSELKDLSFKNTNDYFDFIENHISTSTYPFTGSPVSGLQGIGFLESRNLKFEKVFFLDCNDSAFPNIFKEDPLLPHFVREKVGLPDYKDSLNLYSFYFENLIYGAKKAFIFYIDTKGVGISPIANKLKWRIEKKGEKPKESFSFSSMSFSSKEIRPIKKTEEITRLLRDFEFSHTSISQYLSCQLKFYYFYILKLEEADNIEEEVDKRKVGEIIHKILELYFKEKQKTGFSNLKMEKENILKIAREVLAKYLPYYNKEGDEYIIYAQIIRRIEDFISFHFSKHQGAEIIGCETKEKFIFSSKDLKIKFTVRADRIDKRKNNEIIICDYKTSQEAKIQNKNMEKIDFKEDIIKWGKQINSLQLPIYSMAFAERFKKNSYEINGSIILLGKKNIEEVMLFDEEAERKEKMDLYQKILSEILSDILKSPEFRPPENESQCKNCPYTTICGKNI